LYANICAVSARAAFDIARIVIDQAVRLGVAQADFTGCQQMAAD
jgi:chromosome condensin MukBEF complex kleisin-like MukF subunit